MALTPEDQAKWDDWRRRLDEWKARDAATGGHAGPKPPAPTQAEAPSAYPSDAQFTEPNAAGGGTGNSSTSGFTYDPNKETTAPPSTAWNTPKDDAGDPRPKGQFDADHPEGSPGTPGGGAVGGYVVVPPPPPPTSTAAGPDLGYLDRYRQLLDQTRTNAEGRLAPQASPVGATYGGVSSYEAGRADDSGQSKNYQGDALSALKAMASGQFGSRAETLLKNQGQVNAGRAAGLAAARGRGGRKGDIDSILRAKAEMDLNTTGQMADLRAQEQRDAIGALGQLSSQARGQDASMSQFNVGQGNAASQFRSTELNKASQQDADREVQVRLNNLKAELESRGLNDAQVRSTLLQQTELIKSQVEQEFLSGEKQKDRDLERWKAQYGGDIHDKDILGAVANVIGAGIGAVAKKG